MQINIIACLDQNGAIGYKNQLLFHIRKDMERFKQLTLNHTIVMGRKTYDSPPWRTPIKTQHRDNTTGNTTGKL